MEDCHLFVTYLTCTHVYSKQDTDLGLLFLSVAATRCVAIVYIGDSGPRNVDETFTVYIYQSINRSIDQFKCFSTVYLVINVFEPAHAPPSPRINKTGKKQAPFIKQHKVASPFVQIYTALRTECTSG